MLQLILVSTFQERKKFSTQQHCLVQIIISEFQYISINAGDNPQFFKLLSLGTFETKRAFNNSPLKFQNSPVKVNIL